MKLSSEQEERIRHDLEERADYITVSELRDSTVCDDFFNDVQKKLVGRGTKLVVGPRGCGKTHMMRFAQLSCSDKSSAPFAVYVSFNRYYRLEPMLQSKPNALELFKAWMLANIVTATHDACRLFLGEEGASKFAIQLGMDPLQHWDLVGKLETSTPLESDAVALMGELTVGRVAALVEQCSDFASRKRAILLLDDAALTLTPDYLAEFFDVVRAIKTTRIAPKASIYPGTTEFGPRFHAVHEAEQVPVWLSPQHPSYDKMMTEIGSRRFPAQSLNADAVVQLRYASFGVPRAYLAMLRRFSESKESTQPALNATIDEHMTARLAEFRSLAKKVPKFESLVDVGEELFRESVALLASVNIEIQDNKRQLYLGLTGTWLPLEERMLSLLLEAGLFFEHPKVNHGDHGTYRRFTPHLAALMQRRAFSGSSRGVSPKRVVEFLSRPDSKHPVRRTLATLLKPQIMERMRLSMPPCSKCTHERMSESQKFCHNCGSELITTSTFANYMELPLSDIPGFTPWQKKNIENFTGLKTIGDLLAYQDPGSELRKIPRVGRTRAKDMLSLVSAYVDEYFS